MSGFCFVVVGSDGAAARHPAPLQGVTVTGLIRDAVAEYTMTQTFQNPFAREHIDGAYTFPLYEGAAVTAFQAEVDGRTIQGRVAEEVAAQEDYDAAVRDGKTASLLEQQSPELFHARIGNVPPGKSVVIRITVVSEIRHDGGENHVRFVLPTAVAPRASFFGPHRGFVPAAKLHFDVGCAMTTPIASVQSPSHTIEVHVGGDDRGAAFFDPTRARVSLTEDALLDRDLVVVVQCRGLDQPRVLVERHARDGTHAVAVTFQPRFEVARVRAAELVFLVDVRSGALTSRAAEALALFLRYVPLENHYFNVIARGSAFKGGAPEALFPASVEATAESLRAGVRCAEHVGIGSGSSALVQEALRRRRRDVPTQIFLITDGETVDLAQEVRSEGDRHEFRLFAFGIGDAISHQRIQCVARAGRGYALFVMASERLEKKVSTMMRAALTPPVTETTIQWTDSVIDGKDHEEASATNPQLISLFSDSDPPLAVGEATPPPEISATIYQAPLTLPILSPGARFTVYAILSPATSLPKEIVVRGVTPDGPAELRVPLGAAVEGETMLHALAARALARDFEEGASSVHALAKRALAAHEKRQLKHLGVGMASPVSALPLSFNHVAEIAKQKLIDIGETYCLATKYTSWVAVDEDGPRNTREVASYVVSFAHPAPSFVHNAASVFSGFGQQTPSSGSYHPVDNQTNSSLFGGFTPAFGAPCEPAFGASAFGAAPASAFAAGQSSAFGAFPAFGSHFQASSTPAFGSPFQASATPFGSQFQASPPAFGSPFQASSDQAFGGTPAPAFGSPFQASSAQGFGSLFEASSAPTFGRTQAAGFGNTPAPVFGSPSQASSAPAFGAPQPSAFGAQTPFSSRASLFGNAPLPTDPQTRLQSLLQHQMFDGLFPLIPTIAALFNTSVDTLKARLGELRKQGYAELPEEQCEAIWATCLAVEFVKSKMPELEQQWKLAVEKAERRVESLVKSPEQIARLKAAAKAP